MIYIPQKENITVNTQDKIIYEYCDITCKPIFKAIEIDKNGDKITLNLYRVNRKNDDITIGKLKKIEFIGWDNLPGLPSHFKKVYSRIEYYGVPT
jgi:hypothetical protein